MNFWIIIWTILIFASVAWYGFLLFYIGAKGGREENENGDDAIHEGRLPEAEGRIV